MKNDHHPTEIEAVLRRSSMAREHADEPHITQKNAVVRGLVKLGACGLAATAGAIVVTRTILSAKHCAEITVSDHANNQIGADLLDMYGGELPSMGAIKVRSMDRLRALAYLLSYGEIRREGRIRSGHDVIAKFDIAWYLAHHAVYRAIYSRRRPVGILIVNDLSIERIAMMSAAAREGIPIGLSLMDVAVKKLPPVRPDIVFAWDKWQGNTFQGSRVLVRPVPVIERVRSIRGSLRVLILASAFEKPEELSKLADEIVSADASLSVAIRTHPRVAAFEPISDVVDRVIAGSDESLAASLSRADVVLGGESSSLFQAHRWGWPTARVDSEYRGCESGGETRGKSMPRLSRPIRTADIKLLASHSPTEVVAFDEEKDKWRNGWNEFLRGDSVHHADLP